jgi:type I restriction enzyme, R subunit
LGDACEKVKRLINEHLISLGINPKVPPVELLSEDFIQKLNEHAADNDEAKASEMEHAIRKHCTVYFDEVPSFYKSLSEKVENLIEKHQGEWDVLAKELEKLRGVAIAGRQGGEEGMTKEATTFYDYIVALSFPDGSVPAESKTAVKALMEQVVEQLQDSIGSIDFWHNPDKQKKMRSELKHCVLLSGVDALKQNRERIAVEIMKLAKNRHDELLKS